MPNQNVNVQTYGHGLKTSKKPILGERVLAVGDKGFWDLQGQITIGDHSFFAHGVKLLTGGHDYTFTGRARQDACVAQPITIGKGVWIASYAIILGGVTIGDNAVVGCGSIVTKDIPAGELWAGNPAKFIKKIKLKETDEK